MDADSKTEVARETRSFVARLVIAWLAIVLALGLWQGYGQWLLGGGGAHVP